MCGICGQFNFATNEPVQRETLARMTSTIIHRGPDDEGFHLDGSLGLGFRRLAILDLSPAGHQPMSDDDGKTWIVFNGEIYNFQEIRAELENLGHRFKSHCDTEVIVRGYRQWGEAILQRLNGMFGLAIWDAEKRKLIVARDPMGIKPVYYAIRDGRLFFGSEIRPIMAALGEKRQVDPVALNLFLRYRYTPAPLTLFKGIRKLAPGEQLVVQNGQVKNSRWYNFAPKPFAKMPTHAEAKEALLDLYKRAMKRHLISDVPLGLLLSGGIDSGLLLGLMNLYGKEWHTFTVGYGQSFKDDELSDAAETARIYGAKHSTVQLTKETFEAALPKIVDVLEEPIASSSIVPMYFVCERARQDVKVALIGQGPDELFGGYTRHVGVHYGSYFRSLPSWMRSGVAGVVNALPRNESGKRAMYSLGIADRMKRYQQVFSIQPGPTIDSLFRGDLLPTDIDNKVLECWADHKSAMSELDELNGFQLLELRSSLPDELLMYGDKLSMAHALEGRVPYLDRDVVEYTQQLDASFKIRGRSRKWLHRQVCRDFLPPQIIARKKRGFAVNVVDDWFNSSLRGKIDGYLRDEKSAMYEFLKPGVVQQLMKDHEARRHDNHKILFSLVVFEQWLRSAG
ncbi:MAG: asparagine synthase (glutamine-hydrolyzing) [Nibricoccus sp.]